MRQRDEQNNFLIQIKKNMKLYPFKCNLPLSRQIFEAPLSFPSNQKISIPFSHSLDKRDSYHTTQPVREIVTSALLQKCF